MKLVRCKDQAHASLEDHYGGTEAGPQAMLQLILRLRAMPDKRQVWGLTSIGRLCLLAADTYESPWFVIIGALDERNYFIEYLLPEPAAPWPNAYVKGEARSEDQAVEMILTAMDKSGGWNDEHDA